jgi:AraC-like DNA-binding protein/mannose-6-phosphate isomerase-like protein (cupin superfamily)
MSDGTPRKKEGFQGQKAIVIPRKILATQSEKDKIVGALTITDIGYYPKAKFHYRERSHGTDQHILIYCREGQGWTEIQKSEYSIKAGEFFIVPASAPHKYEANETDPWTIYWIHFKGDISNEIVSSLLKQLDSHKGFIHYTEDRINLFNNIYNQLEKGYSHDNLAYANMSFWYFLATFMFQDKYLNSDKISKQDITDKAIDFMTNNIDQMINVDEIARSVNLSVSHFTSLFKKKTGFSPIEYYNHLKIQKACQYLIFTDLRVKEISYKLGINDPYYFSRLFTKVMGASPNEYREKKAL